MAEGIVWLLRGEPSRNLMRTTTAALALFAVMGCAQGEPQTDQQVVANALDADVQITDDADERADRLDEKSGELLTEALSTGGATGQALRAEAKADTAAAAALRQQGERSGVDAADSIEQNAGLLNGR